MLQFHLPPVNVTHREVGPKLSKFEQVSSDHHQVSLVGGRTLGLMSGGEGVGPRSNF